MIFSLLERLSINLPLFFFFFFSFYFYLRAWWSALLACKFWVGEGEGPSVAAPGEAWKQTLSSSAWRAKQPKVHFSTQRLSVVMCSGRLKLGNVDSNLPGGHTAMFIQRHTLPINK